MLISDWSSDVCSSDLERLFQRGGGDTERHGGIAAAFEVKSLHQLAEAAGRHDRVIARHPRALEEDVAGGNPAKADRKSVVQDTSGSVSVDRGGRSNIKNTHHQNTAINRRNPTP